MSYARENRVREASSMRDLLRFDPRLEVGAYITDGNNLYEVVRRIEGQVILENCITEAWKGTVAWRVLEDYDLVKHPPQSPDCVDMSVGDLA
jgi:hypothetical protein